MAVHCIIKEPLPFTSRLLNMAYFPKATASATGQKHFTKEQKLLSNTNTFGLTCTKGLYTTAVTALATAFVYGLSQEIGLDVEMVLHLWIISSCLSANPNWTRANQNRLVLGFLKLT